MGGENRRTDTCPRRIVQDFSESGLIVQGVDGAEHRISWPQICGISAGWTKDKHDWQLLVLIFDLDFRGEQLLALVSETDPVWSRLTQALPALLHGVPEFDIWANSALKTRMPISIYDRAY